MAIHVCNRANRQMTDDRRTGDSI